ncbi:MAG: hypothetical protein QM714_10975 [Nocardioides sp.]|uniref:hypothetical protein n=1 Tax=Nocardioides sp. TaxID=35761 RepID=UPI0039E589D3
MRAGLSVGGRWVGAEARLRVVALGVALGMIGCLWAQPAVGVQVGAVASGADYTYGMRSKVGEPGHFIYGDHARAYWPGVTFPDGTFFQAGVVDSDNGWGSDKCSTGFATFETALYGGHSLFSDLYNIRNCNYSGDHYFTLDRSYSSTDTLWKWKLEGKKVGPTLHFSNFTNTSFQKKNAGAISEIVYVGNIPSGLPFPTVEYSPSIQFKNSSGVFEGATHGRALISSDRNGLCQYAVKSPGHNQVVTGKSGNINPPQCYSNGDDLWN